ncbi:MAG: hypothetical protein ACOX6L_12640 [Syntrophomonadaceae bacterium]
MAGRAGGGRDPAGGEISRRSSICRAGLQFIRARRENTSADVDNVESKIDHMDYIRR